MGRIDWDERKVGACTAPMARRGANTTSPFRTGNLSEKTKSSMAFRRRLTGFPNKFFEQGCLLSKTPGGDTLPISEAFSRADSPRKTSKSHILRMSGRPLDQCSSTSCCRESRCCRCWQMSYSAKVNVYHHASARSGIVWSSSH